MKVVMCTNIISIIGISCEIIALQCQCDISFVVDSLFDNKIIKNVEPKLSTPKNSLKKNLPNLKVGPTVYTFLNL